MRIFRHDDRIKVGLWKRLDLIWQVVYMFTVRVRENSLQKTEVNMDIKKNDRVCTGDKSKLSATTITRNGTLRRITDLESESRKTITMLKGEAHLLISSSFSSPDNECRQKWQTQRILLADHAVVDSGCSMPYDWQLKAYLSDYEDYNGGFVAFRSDPKGALSFLMKVKLYLELLERMTDKFIVGKVVKYHLISKTTTKIFDIGSNQMDDDDAIEFILPFEVDPNIYEIIPSLACVDYQSL
ncbi:hypothetical protein Tco_0762528 [Tanacetum coccineum]